MGRHGEPTLSWVVDDFRRVLAALGRRETWMFLGMATVVASIVGAAFKYALHLDFLLRLRSLTTSACHEVGNGSTALLFAATVFFALTLVAAFGELARHADFKRHRAVAAARSAGWHSLGWGTLSLLIGAALVVMLDSQCM